MRTHSKTPLFLMELIIMLLVFSVSAAICLQVFAGARRISNESRLLDQAVMQAQTAAEYWKATHGDVDETAELLGGKVNGDLLILYDEDNQLQMNLRCENTTACIVILYEEEEIFSMDCEAVMSHG